MAPSSSLRSSSRRSGSTLALSSPVNNSLHEMGEVLS